MKVRLVLRLPIAAIPAALGCSDAATAPPTVTLFPRNVALLVCQEVQLTTRTTPANTPVVFRSDNGAAVTVSPTGVIRGVRDGAANIYAEHASRSSIRDSVFVTVASPGPCASETPGRA